MREQNMIYAETEQYAAVSKRNKILPHVMPSANLEVIALREICQPQKDKRCGMPLARSQNVPSWGLPGEGRRAPSCGGLRVLRFCFARRQVTQQRGLN